MAVSSLGWCLLFGAAAAAAMIQLEWSLILLVAGLGILVGGLAFVWRQRQRRGSGIKKGTFLEQILSMQFYQA